jgi:hypothetical protein
MKRNTWIFAGLSLLVFIMLIFPNATGAKEANMLAVFEIDEFAQYPHLVRMLTQGDSLYQTIRNFVVYLHYFYGYPFYFFSALAALPLRLVLGSDWVNHTQSIVATLRQAISVLPMLLSIGLWLSMTKAFKSTLKTILGFVLLLAIPAVFENFFWWHPDSLAFFFVSLTFFFLLRDNLQFKRGFWLAAITAGLAIGTKHLGEFFFLTIPFYLIYGVILQKLKWQKALLFAAGFVGLMAAAIVVSNPLLLLPIERGEVIRYQVMQWNETTQGSLVQHQSMSLGTFFRFLGQHAASIPMVLLTLAAFYFDIRDKKIRLFSLILISFLLPYGLVIFGGSSLRPNYLIPFIIPFLSLLLLHLPEKLPISFSKDWFAGLALLLVVLQIIWFVPTNYETYANILNREKTAPSIVFYETVREMIPADTESVFRDWQIYLPENAPYSVHFDWDNATYDRIEAIQPDLILLEQSRIALFSNQNPDVQLSENVDGEAWLRFYSDAYANSIAGYDLLYENEFAKAFIRK